ncbi:MAG TPA: sporulation protein YunB [Limnochordia bacterium]|nr:sporulation protein YunB [Bacillota bacterium]HKM18395.1 sporulation protein YunB [Limnochordia bacterium]
MTRLRWRSTFRRPSPRRVESESGKLPTPSPGWLRSALLVLLVLALLAAVAGLVVEKRVTPVLYAWAETKAVNLATQAINLAVEETMLQANVLEMAEIITDDSGRIQAVKYDTAKISQTAAAIAQKVLQALHDLDPETLSIPLGRFLGSDMFSGFGPRVPLRAFPAGAVTATPVSSFVTAGINQTIHRLYLDIKVEMRIVVPLASAKLPVSTRVALIEDIIVGAVPSWYLAPVGLVGGFDQLAGAESSPGSIEFIIGQ